MGLTPEQAAKNISETPRGRVAFYDAARGEIVKPDGWQPPDFRSLIKVAQTEQGRSEVSCVLEHVQGVTMAKPMIFTDGTHPTHYAFANQVGVQTEEDAQGAPQIPDELSRTIESHLWLANLKIHQALPLPCPRRQECPGNRTPRVQLKPHGISWLPSKLHLSRHMLLMMYRGCYEEWFLTCIYLLSFLGRQDSHPMLSTFVAYLVRSFPSSFGEGGGPHPFQNSTRPCGVLWVLGRYCRCSNFWKMLKGSVQMMR